MSIKLGFLNFILILAILTSAVAHGAEGKHVGIFQDRRSAGAAGVAKTLEKQGYSTSMLSANDIQDAENLKDIDVIYLPGGWNQIDFAGFHGRKNLVEFVARGKGILAGAFRSGWFRTANRPLLPQVGCTVFKSNALYIFPRGTGPLVEGVDGPAFTANWDTMQVKAGPQGRVFAVDASGIPVGVFGEIYGGRYVILGDFIHMTDEEMADTRLTRMFLNSIRWLAGTEKRDADDVVANVRMAEEDFLRTDLLLDWLHDQTGPDAGPGLIPDVRYALEMSLYSRMWQLEYITAYLKGDDRAACETAIAGIQEDAEVVQRNFLKLAALKRNEIESLSIKALRDANLLTMDAGKRDQAFQTVEDEALRARLAQSLSRGRLSNKAWIKQMESESVRNTLLLNTDLEKRIADADLIIEEMRPRARTAMKQQFALAGKLDTEKIPGLIQTLASDNIREKRHAVAELGRIGDKRAAPALIAGLNGKDTEMIVGVIQALAWMQAEQAVPGLIALLENSNPRIRRRIAQALGQIGDDRAVQPLLSLLKDEDFHVRHNAVFSLGWLKAGKAVPSLLELIETGDRECPYQRDLMIAAVRALGHIGDSRALTLLKDLAENAGDYPDASRGRGPRHTNIYAIGTTLGLQGHAELAVAAIETGGLSRKGIEQPGFLSRKEKFSPFKDNFNFLAGRPFGAAYQGHFSDNPYGLFAFIRSLGATGVHCAWDITRQPYQPDEYKELLTKAGDYDLKWIDTMPSVNNGVFHAKKHSLYKENGALLCKATAENTILAYLDVPAFQGFWFEECWPFVSSEDSQIKHKLATLLEKKYGPDYSSVISWESGDEIRQPTAESSDEERRLWAAFLEVAGESTIDEWRESQEWLQGLRKGCAFTYNESVGHLFGYLGNFSKAGAVISAFGPESYLSFDPNATLAMELSKDGEARPVLCEFYNWYDPSDRHSEIGYAKQLVHAECFFNFDLAQLIKAPSVYMYYYKANLQKIAGAVFRKAEKLKEYLAGGGSAANVALVASERTAVLFYNLKINESAPPRRYYQHLSAFWEAIRQLGIPSDAIWAETMTPEKIARYRVLILPDAKSLTAGQIRILSDWVGAGGVLIATGSTSLFDENGIKQANYGLSEVFGVDYHEDTDRHAEDDGDTLCFVQGQPPEKVFDEQFEREKIYRPVLRELKPRSSLGLYTVKNRTELLPELPEAFGCEYDLPLGYDRVSTNSAKILAEFADGSPALTVNRLGRGLCYFWTPVYPGLCHTIGDIVYTPIVYKFWPGVRDVLGAMIAGGFKTMGDAPAVKIVSGPVESLETVVRSWPDKRRWVIHLLNINAQLDMARGVNLSVRVLDMEKIKVYYPDTGEKIVTVKSAGGAAFSVRDFDVHEMIVVEY